MKDIIAFENMFHEDICFSEFYTINDFAHL
jgi:hypothetical protein